MYIEPKELNLFPIEPNMSYDKTLSQMIWTIEAKLDEAPPNLDRSTLQDLFNLQLTLTDYLRKHNTLIRVVK
jgi:hypothetical protein